MATRSLIGKLNSDGTITNIYCHFDGYPEHNGVILQKHYYTPFKVDQLLALGNLSWLGEQIGEKQDFNKRAKGVGVRGKVNCNKWRLPTKEEFENVLYPNQDKIPNLNLYPAYWSSSEYDPKYAWSFNFRFGEAYNFSNKFFTNQVRAVRDVSSHSTNSSNSTIIGNLEVYSTDLGSMTWNEATKAVEKLNMDEGGMIETQNYDWCLAYGRDRGDYYQQAQVSMHESFFSTDHGVDYLYLYNNEFEWECYNAWTLEPQNISVVEAA